MTIKKNLFLIIISSFLYFNCSDEPTSITGDIPPKNAISLNTINSNDDSLSQTSSYTHQDNVRLSSASRILIGKINDEINASILIKFAAAIADSIKEDILNDNITVTSAEMEFVQVYSFGEENSAIDFTVHKALENWSIDITEDSIVQIDPADSKIAPIDFGDSITTITLSNQLLLEWLDIIADTSLNGNYGVHIKPTDNTGKVLGYQGITTTLSNVPFIRVVVEKQGAYTDTIFFSSTADLTVMKGSIPQVSNEDIVVRAGYIINSVLSFDLSNVPENIVVNKAELFLTADSLQTEIGSGGINSLRAYLLFDSTNTDSVSSSSVNLLRSGNTFYGQITNYVSSWLNNNNQGLLLSAADPLNGVERFVIKGSNADISNRPLLKITYTKQN